MLKLGYIKTSINYWNNGVEIWRNRFLHYLDDLDLEEFIDESISELLTESVMETSFPSHDDQLELKLKRI